MTEQHTIVSATEDLIRFCFICNSNTTILCVYAVHPYSMLTPSRMANNHRQIVIIKSELQNALHALPKPGAESPSKWDCPKTVESMVMSAMHC